MPSRLAAMESESSELTGNSMQSSKDPIYDYLVWAVIALSPFQDTALQNTFLRLPAASLSFLPLMALFLLTATRRLLRGSFTVNRTLLLMGAYAVIVCAANLVWITRENEVEIHLESVFARFLLSSLVLFIVLGVNYRVNRGLRIAVYLGFFFTIVGIVCGQVLGANAISFLQATPNLSDRPSGFSTEASTLSVQVVCSGILTAHCLKTKWMKWAAGVMTCVLLLYSSSKGGLIALLLCVLVLAIARTRTSMVAKIGAAAVLLPAVYFGSLLIFSSFSTLVQFNQTTTIATRFSMAVYAVITVAHNPCGVGFTGFLPSITRYLPSAMSFVERLFPFPLAFVEVRGYLYPPQQDADCKTLFFDYLACFGLPFAILFIMSVRRLLRLLFKHELRWLFVGVLFSVTAATTYYSTVNAWTLPLLFGISLHEIKRAENTLRLH